jgi:hypothetical protein
LLLSHAQAASVSLQVGSEQVFVAAPDGYQALKITLSLPDGTVLERRFDAKHGASLDLGLGTPANGSYNYRVDFEAAARAQGERRVTGTMWAPATGTFGVVDGALARGEIEGGAQAKDVIQPDDYIVQGGLCVGNDCVDGEVFSFQQLKVKHNNPRMRFEDTSAAAGFATTDWLLIANDSASGGQARFAIQDLDASRIPFTLEASAPTDSLYVDSSGRVGLRTATPALDLHINTSNTPAIRLEQNSSGGFTAQTWDIAGNEANFFVRDVTGGSLLPFRIRPGAPTSSIDITNAGNVSFGDGTALARIDITANAPLATPIAALRITNDDGGVPDLVEDRFVVDSSGNVTARGTIAQLSSRSAKENFVEIDGDDVLTRLAALSVPSWNYLGDAQRHIGPIAEDFHAAFAVGGDPRYLAPADVAGVALAAVKAMQDQVRERDAHIAELEARLARIEAALAR